MAPRSRPTRFEQRGAPAARRPRRRGGRRVGRRRQRLRLGAAAGHVAVGVVSARVSLGEVAGLARAEFAVSCISGGESFWATYYPNNDQVGTHLAGKSFNA